MGHTQQDQYHVADGQSIGGDARQVRKANCY